MHPGERGALSQPPSGPRRARGDTERWPLVPGCRACVALSLPFEAAGRVPCVIGKVPIWPVLAPPSQDAALQLSPGIAAGLRPAQGCAHSVQAAWPTLSLRMLTERARTDTTTRVLTTRVCCCRHPVPKARRRSPGGGARALAVPGCRWLGAPAVNCQ